MKTLTEQLQEQKREQSKSLTPEFLTKINKDAHEGLEYYTDKEGKKCYGIKK